MSSRTMTCQSDGRSQESQRLPMTSSELDTEQGIVCPLEWRRHLICYTIVSLHDCDRLYEAKYSLPASLLTPAIASMPFWRSDLSSSFVPGSLAPTCAGLTVSWDPFPYRSRSLTMSRAPSSSAPRRRRRQAPLAPVLRPRCRCAIQQQEASRQPILTALLAHLQRISRPAITDISFWTCAQLSSAVRAGSTGVAFML